MKTSQLSFAFFLTVSAFSISTESVLADSTIIRNPLNKHWYQCFDNSMGWYFAKAFCEKRGGYLATITSQNENDFVWANLASKATNPGIWLGATNDKTGTSVYQWITGEAWSYTNWDIGEPNDYAVIANGGEHYLQFSKYPQSPTGKWNDSSSYNQGGASTLGYGTTSAICEWGGGGSWGF